MRNLLRIAGIFAFTLALACVQDSRHGHAQEKKKDPPSETKKSDKGFESDADAKEVLKLIAAAMKKKDHHTSEMIGGGPFFWDDFPPQGGILVGLEISAGTTTIGMTETSAKVVKTIRPIYLSTNGTRTPGKQHGFAVSKPVKIEAKPGYAVGAVNYHARGEFIKGMSVTFMRIRGAGLDTKDSYKSTFYGSGDPETTTVLGGTGKPIIGMNGCNIEVRSGCQLGFRFHYLGPETEKKKE